jgi:hypothetical protein
MVAFQKQLEATDAPIPAHTDKTLAARQHHERQRDLVAKSLRRW